MQAVAAELSGCAGQFRCFFGEKSFKKVCFDPFIRYSSAGKPLDQVFKPIHKAHKLLDRDSDSVQAAFEPSRD
jgi:hypothetical protein